MYHAHIIGVAKCGTTTLAEALSKHTDITLAAGKEAHFFDVDEIFAKGYKYYHSAFLTADLFNIDATPAYICQANYLRRLADYYRVHGLRPRIIVLIRNPTERAISHYLDRYRVGQVTEDFFEIAERQIVEGHRDSGAWDQYIGDGEYKRIFEILFSIFEEDDVLVLSNVELRTSMNYCLRAILAFLELPDQSDAMVSMASGNLNISGSPKSLWLARQIAKDSVPKRLLKRTINRHALRKMGTAVNSWNRRPEKAAIAEQISSDPRRTRLDEHYATDVDFVLHKFGKQL
ncbi:sulfotransferase domain-containing protein [Oricola indica]|uniref:sulfotransferase domain-containing protein n=1 Tax=Oricola indica TaxID=2872591 RepID=UPI003CCBA378